ncbi:MAG: hypothetical protein OJF61_001452 [Rhodanobacteraceae bacterium]|jgi:hypothetical protein|nr:MAG: hypothetical protein OJF61_001452 [Rhodanobacteraceae bacterium]
MKRKSMLCAAALAVAGCLSLGGCVVAPARPAYVAVAPAPVWVSGYWYGGVWIRGHWRYR